MAVRFHSEEGGAKRVAGPYASKAPKTNLNSLLSYYFGHPTSTEYDHEADTPEGPYHSRGTDF